MNGFCLRVEKYKANVRSDRFYADNIYSLNDHYKYIN